MVTIEQVDAVIGKPVMIATVFNTEPRQMIFHKRVRQRVEYSSGVLGGVIDLDAIVSIEPVAYQPVQTELEKAIRKLLTSEENNLLDRWLNDGNQVPRDEWIGWLVARSIKQFVLGNNQNVTM